MGSNGVLWSCHNTRFKMIMCQSHIMLMHKNITLKPYLRIIKKNLICMENSYIVRSNALVSHCGCTPLWVPRLGPTPYVRAWLGCTNPGTVVDTIWRYEQFFNKKKHGTIDKTSLRRGYDIPNKISVLLESRSVCLFSNASALLLYLHFLASPMALFMDQSKHKNAWTVASEQCFAF